ncbi:hypothetical protein PMAYCL1PPCAC_28229, partial [Pristionchus mayeri]
MVTGQTIHIIEEQVVDSEEESEEMSEATDIAILIIIIGLLVSALFYMYNKTVQNETALATALRLNKAIAMEVDAKNARDRDRVREAKDVLRLLEKYERRKKRAEESSTEHSTEDKDKKKKKKRQFGRTVLSITEGGYKIPWIEGSGKLIELGPSLIKSMLEPSEATPMRCSEPREKRSIGKA